jgi:tRNA A-37 threonylcarbamoyl transferase component Bud32
MNGQRLGQFQLDRVIGEGGMGVVYLAHHVTLKSPAVVKMLKPEFTRHAEILQRFVNEARAAAHLNHRNFVQVYDCGQASDGQWYIALKFLDGAPLSRLISSFEGRPIDPVTIVHVLCQACNALQVAHEHGIVHRDVKPDNIFLTQQDGNDRYVTLLDFGIAKLGEGDWNVSTRSGVVMGTLAYMAPEQLLNSKAVDSRSDVYALGVVAFEMLTGGYLPFGTDFASQVELYGRQTRGELPDPRRIFAGVSDAMAFVVGRALHPDPSQRWQTARELALALAEAAPSPGPGVPGGMDLLETYARELRQVPNDATTVGNRVRDIAGAAAGGSVHSRPGMNAPPVHTLSTLSGAARHVVSPRRASRAWMGALGAAVVIAGVAFVALRAEQEGDTPVARAPAQDAAAKGGQLIEAAVPLVEVTVVTTPAGARVTVDGGERGMSPATVSVPAGSDIRVRAELAGFEPTERTIRVGATPEEIALGLQPMLADAGVSDAGAPDASTRHRSSSKTRGRPQRTQPTTPVNLDDVGGD